MNADTLVGYTLVAGALIALAWLGSGRLRDLRDRAEATRQHHDLESFFDWLAEDDVLYGPAAVWPLDEKTETFDEDSIAAIRDRVARIRTQIRINEMARFEREVLADIEQLPEVAS